jgi:hypothetical protein
MPPTSSALRSIDASMPGSRFVVTGCARSGTLFIAQALSGLGHPCDHEVLFNPDTKRVPDFGAAEGDVSWLAAPFISDLPAGTVLLHQVRDPLATVRSLVGMRVFQTKPHPLMQLRYRLQHHRVRFARPIANPRFVRFAADHCPEAFEPDDETSRAAAYWVRWNCMIEDAADRAHLTYRRYRVEDLDDDLLTEFDHLLGGSATPAEVAAIRTGLGTSTHRARQVDALTIADIRDSTIRSRLARLAAEFGYDLSGR